MARKAPQPPVESSSDDEPIFDDAQPEQQLESSSSSGEEEETPPPKNPPTQKKPDPPRPSLDSDTNSDEEDEDDDEDTPSPPKKTSTQKKPDPVKSAIESESDSDEEEETPPSPKKAPTLKNSDPPKPAIESESDSDDEEEEKPPSPPPKKALTQKKQGPSKTTLESDKVKPIESKPMVKSKPPVTVLASPAVFLSNKRSRGSDTTEKKAKKEKLEGSNDESGKKPMFQRLWSEQDEVVILEGMIEYKVKNGVDPMSVADNFLEFIKKSLTVDVNKTQLLGKVRALKRRFENSKKKKSIVDPHGIKLVELGKKIWENDADVKSSVSGEGKDSKSGTKKRKAGVEKSKGVKEDVNGAVSEDEKVEEEEKLQDWVISKREKELKLDDLGNCGFVKDGVLKEMINSLDEGDKAKIREKWKKHNLEEMELYLKKLDILKEMTQQTLNAMKST